MATAQFDYNFDPTASDTDLPETLYHYTDLNGFRGMWEEGDIWATHFEFLNDTSELRLGALVAQTELAERELALLRVFANRLKERLRQQGGSEEPDTGSVLDAISEIAPDRKELAEIQAAIKVAAKAMNGYIACLTEQGDQLSQWRGYAREGVCVGFDSRILLAGLTRHRTVRRVHYYAEETREELAARMVGVARGILNLMLTQDEMDEDFRKYVLGKQILLDSAFVKDKSFAEEQEVRIVQIDGEPDFFSSHRYGLVPRVKIPIPEGAIKSVTVGPSPHADLKQRSLLRYFFRVGFKEATVTDMDSHPEILKSLIPYRDW